MLIGISILDSLHTLDLIKVVLGELRMNIPEKLTLQTSVDISRTPEPQPPLKLMSESKIKTLCRMEIESRFGLEYLKQKIENMYGEK